jgi:two-component system, OmpR family, sensor histidine kinase MprB
MRTHTSNEDPAARRANLTPSAWLSRHSFRSRITLLVVGAVGLSVALGALISYLAISRAIMNRVDNELEQRATVLTAMPLGMFYPAQVNSLRSVLAASGYQESIVYDDASSYQPPTLALQQPGAGQTPGQILATYQISAPFGQPEIEVAVQQSGSSLRTINYQGTDYRVYAVPNTYGGEAQYNPEPSALVFSTSMAPTESTLNTIAVITTIVGLLGIGLAAAAGFAIGRAALRPVRELSDATEYIAQSGDLRLLPVNGSDELAQLTKNFNTMLEALARSREHQKRLVADAGHELRTPLTSMRTNLDLLAHVMAAPDDDRFPPEERAALMSDLGAQMEELTVLISDLVELSRDEQPSHSIEHLDLRHIIERATERVQRRAPSVTFKLRLSPWYLEGDASALERMVTNLLDNAAKFSPENGTVTVTLKEGLLQVADEGPGIAEEDLTHVFERFYRSPEARATPGSGLGLAIVRQVAENHGGRVAAARAPGGGALLGVWLTGDSAEALV